MRTFVLITLVLLAGCERIPGTAANAIARGEALVREQLRDPASAQFRAGVSRRIQLGDNSRVHSICGEVNAKNAMGGYVGFARYAVNLDAGVAAIDSGSTVSQQQVDAARSLCASVGGSCAYVDEMAAELARQTDFDNLWSSICSDGR